MPKTTYLDNAVCNWVKGTAMPTAPVAVYVGLWNGDPTVSGAGGTEVTTTIRVAGRLAVTFGAVSGGSMTNSAIVNFGNAAGAATVTHFAILDAASAGNMLGSAPLAGGPQSIAINAAVSFAASTLNWIET